MGEELIDAYFAVLRESGLIEQYEWISAHNAISPYDFTLLNGTEKKVEVKSTCGKFDSVMHISNREFEEMQSDEDYQLYRIYELNGTTAKLRIATHLKPFVDSLYSTMNSLPSGVSFDSISVRPSCLIFCDEVVIDLALTENLEILDS